MPTSASDIFELAQHIQATRLNEAGRRSATSRAYYAAMHRTLEVFGKPASRGDHESTHKAVVRMVSETAKAPGPVRGEASRIAQQLDLLRRRRNDADYELAPDFDKAQCQDCFARAQRLLDLCHEAKTKLDQHMARVATVPKLASDEPEPPRPPSGPRPSLKRVK